MKTFILGLFVLTVFNGTINSDSPIPKGATSYSANRGGYIAEIFPANSRLANDKLMCYFYSQNTSFSYKKSYSAEDRFKLVWSGQLVHKTYPNSTIISKNGYLVTLDEYPFLGTEHAVVIYDINGELVKDFSLTDLVPENDIRTKMMDTESSILWRINAQYYFSNPKNIEESYSNPTHLYIVLDYGAVIEIDLINGKNTYGSKSDYSHLEILLNKQLIPERTMINEIRLNNSSITELLDCLNE